VPLQNFANFYACRHIFESRIPLGLTGALFGKEGGIQVLAGLAPASQILGPILKTPADQHGRKKLTKSEFDEFTSTKKWTQLFPIELIRRSLKFPKPSYYNFIILSILFLLELSNLCINTVSSPLNWK
jgi:hypothetical protein